MKKINYTLLISVIITGFSCSPSDHADPIPEGEKEVEIHIFTDKHSYRATDIGSNKERQIDELDLLIFKDDQFQYSRRAFKISEGLYKANLKIDNAFLTGHVFANCRTQLANWESEEDKGGKSWSDVQKELIDNSPARWVSDDGKVLPMWGKTSGYVSETQVSGWEAVTLLRSLASVDAYIEQNENTSKFILTDAHLYYAPDKGYLAPVPNGNSFLMKSPPDMETTLNNLKASGVTLMAIESSQGVIVSKQAIANQLYTFDNDIDETNFSPTTTPIRKYTRLILAGFYDQPTPIYNPEEPGVDQRIKTYYPLDFVNSEEKFHGLIRNWKYVFNITNVTGPGYETLEKAADEYPIHMDKTIIDWNRDDVQIGVQGKYYLSMERKNARLSRKAHSTDQLNLTYEILDNAPGEIFSIAFTTEDNGTQVPPTTNDSKPTVIQNDFFQVTIFHDATGKKADLIIEALQDYTESNHQDILEIRFRDLRFHITITQYDYSDDDWNDGGEIPKDL